MGLKESGLRGSLRSTSSVLPAFFDVTITNTNSPVQEGDILTVDYSADNTGDAQDTQDIRLEIDSVQEDVDPGVLLGGGASATGTLEWDTTDEAEAEYTATVLSDDDSDSVTVEIESAIPDAENLQARYDFSEEDGSTPVTDQTGNGYDLTGTYSGVSVSINGTQAGEFDGVDDYLEASWAAESQPNTTYIVARFETTGDVSFVFDADTSEGMGLLSDINDDYRLLSGGSALIGGTSDTNNHIFDVLWDSPNSDFVVDGTSTLSGDPGSADSDGITLGARGDLEQFGQVTIGEVLQYNAGHDSSTQSEVRSYLSDKWGIEL